MGHNGKLGQKYSKVRLNILQIETIIIETLTLTAYFI